MKFEEFMEGLKEIDFYKWLGEWEYILYDQYNLMIENIRRPYEGYDFDADKLYITLRYNYVA